MNYRENKPYDVAYVFDCKGKNDLYSIESFYGQENPDLEKLYSMAELLKDNWESVESIFSDEKTSVYRINPDLFFDYELTEDPDYLVRILDCEYQQGELIIFVNSRAIIEYWNIREGSKDESFDKWMKAIVENERK